MPLSVAWRSISASSSSVKSRRSIAPTLSSSCSTLEAPTSVEVTRGSRSVQASAICASVWPRPAAISFSARIFASDSSVRRSGDRASSGRSARAPSGIPSRYRSVSIPCASGEKRDAADAELAERVEEVGLDPAVQHRVGGLVDEERRPELAQDRGRLARLLGGVGGDARVQRLPLPHGGVERAHRLLERRLRVEAVRVEDVDVVEAEAREALVEAREQVLARPPLAVRAGPHVVAGLRRDDELVAVRRRSRAKSRPKFSSAEPYGGP